MFVLGLMRARYWIFSSKFIKMISLLKITHFLSVIVGFSDTVLPKVSVYSKNGHHQWILHPQKPLFSKFHLVFRDRNNRLSNVGQNVRYLQIFTGHIKKSIGHLMSGNFVNSSGKTEKTWELWRIKILK